MFLDATAGKGILLRNGAGSIKHFDVQIWVQECIKTKNIGVHKISREENKADALAGSSSITDFMRHMSTSGLSFESTVVKFLFFYSSSLKGQSVLRLTPRKEAAKCICSRDAEVRECGSTIHPS